MNHPHFNTKFFKSFTSLIGGVLLLATFLPASAGSWWNPEWTLRKKITIDTSDKGAGISGAIGGTPILIRLHDDGLQFAVAKEDGGDLRFVVADDKTLLPYHIEKYDALMSEVYVWVRVPDLKPGTQTSIWLYYGNAKAERAEKAKDTYDADTVLVYHFGEKGAPASDSSGQGNNAQNAGTPVEGSIIGSGLRLDGHALVAIPNSPSLTWAPSAATTLSLWFKPTILQPNGVILSRKEGASSFVVGVNNGVPYVEVNGQRSSGDAPVAVNSAHHLAVVADASKVTVYLDGAAYGAVGAGLPALGSPLIIGGDGTPGENNAAPTLTAGTAAFNGEIDELEISKVARPEGFIKLAAVGQGADSEAKLFSIGPDEQTSNWMSSLGSGTFGVLIRSLTPDGWAVIAILAVMAVISWWVMFNKASYLGGIQKGNAQFMRAWQNIARDLTVLDHANAENIKTLGGNVDKKGQKQMRHASVYRIYHIGAEEIRHRFAGTPDGVHKVLSAQSIQAIRASLDGGLVREIQRLNNFMVLLTIAIAGGPFLGLLGTVVGVMITFAAIAAAGDVNVNAIAPGIAAALLATVAGLAVAIPSLFGYNYLTVKIKDAISDMQVFVDEFVTKMAEFYRPQKPSDPELPSH